MAQLANQEAKHSATRSAKHSARRLRHFLPMACGGQSHGRAHAATRARCWATAQAPANQEAERGTGGGTGGACAVPLDVLVVVALRDLHVASAHPGGADEPGAGRPQEKAQAAHGAERRPGWCPKRCQPKHATGGEEEPGRSPSTPSLRWRGRTGTVVSTRLHLGGTPERFIFWRMKGRFTLTTL